jgi:hypothetical protein
MADLAGGDQAQGGTTMAGSSSARPRDLAMMQQVLDDYCIEQKIAKRGLLRESIAERIFMLFESGLRTPEQITASLKSVGPSD